MTMLLGIRFLLRPVTKEKERLQTASPRQKAIRAVLVGILIGFICGFICGFIGVGGEMMLLFVLTGLLGYEWKVAVGTSVFVMTFIALTGAISHFVIDRLPNILCMKACIVFTFLQRKNAQEMPVALPGIFYASLLQSVTK